MKAFLRSLGNLIRTITVLVNKPPAHLPPHCSNINALLLHLCDYDAEMHKWVLRWIAYPLRHPGAKMANCLVFSGGEGSGKSTFFELVVAGVYGSSARRVRSSHLRSVFNSWLVGARMVIVVDASVQTLSPQLKPLITQSRILVHERMKLERTEPNETNLVFLSGAIDFLPAAASDLRFVVIEVPPAQSPSFYRAVNAEIQNGGVEAFLQYLLHELDMGDFNERTLPPRPRIAPATCEAA